MLIFYKTTHILYFNGRYYKKDKNIKEEKMFSY